MQLHSDFSNVHETTAILTWSLKLAIFHFRYSHLYNNDKLRRYTIHRKKGEIYLLYVLEAVLRYCAHISLKSRLSCFCSFDILLLSKHIKTTLNYQMISVFCWEAGFNISLNVINKVTVNFLNKILWFIWWSHLVILYTLNQQVALSSQVLVSVNTVGESKQYSSFIIINRQ